MVGSNKALICSFKSTWFVKTSLDFVVMLRTIVPQSDGSGKMASPSAFAVILLTFSHYNVNPR